MKLIINLGEVPMFRRSRALALAVRPCLDGLVEANRLYLSMYPNTPGIYQSGVRYQEEPLGTIEEFASIPVLLGRGWGDCDDLAPWRVAELQQQGEPAAIRINWKMKENGSRLFHVTVRRGDGSVEDPSLLLGMRV